MSPGARSLLHLALKLFASGASGGGARLDGPKKPCGLSTTCLLLQVHPASLSASLSQSKALAKRFWLPELLTVEIEAAARQELELLLIVRLDGIEHFHI